jgi:quinolinate synthase
MDNITKIKQIKEKLGSDLIILAHHYQNDEIVALADYIGDSLKLAQMAEKNKTAKYIVFCGVHFMAETADILTEDWQRVLLPDMQAGCPMANMASLDEAEKAWDVLKAEFGDEDTVPVTYVNSKAEIKAFCGRHGGTVVTSGNAPKVMKWALDSGKRVLFLPDQNLGKNTAYDLGVAIEDMADYDQKTGKLSYSCPADKVKVILWDGYCHVHHKIKLETVEHLRNIKPEHKIIVHPECKFEITQAVDGKGSTEYLINTVKNSAPGSKWIVGTEANLVMRLIHDNPNKDISILDTSSVCFNMNKTNTDNLLATLEQIIDNNFEKQVTVDSNIAADAIKALDTMLSLS